MIRNYSAIDMIRFRNFCKEGKNYGLKPVELIKAYDETFPELSSKDKLINLSKVLGINNLYKTLTGNDISEHDLIEWGHKKEDMSLNDPPKCGKCGMHVDCFSGKCGCNETFEFDSKR